MDPLRFQCETVGFFTRAFAREVGYDDKAVIRMMRGGIWFRFRRGYYSFTDLWNGHNDLERHRIRSRAVLHSLGPAVALSHVSGLVAHGVDVWDVPLERVHVTRLDGGAGCIERDLVHHEGAAGSDGVVEVDGLRVLKPERCALETASWGSGEVALSIFDSVLHRNRCSHDTLYDEFVRLQHWSHTQHLHVPVRMANCQAESPGESRGRWLCWSMGLPAPQVQFRVYDADGVLRGTCDWGWPEHSLLGEFDGRVKYGRLLQPGQDVGEVVFAEKQREDLLREITSYSMIRLVWSDYERPRLTAQRVQRRMRRPG